MISCNHGFCLKEHLGDVGLEHFLGTLSNQTVEEIVQFLGIGDLGTVAPLRVGEDGFQEALAFGELG